jgi:two-component system, NtrC family, nitrogen regulation sensor histidine kinase NtrY
MLALVLISLIVIGLTTLYFFNEQNSEYHFKRSERKEQTVNSSLQYFFKDLQPHEVNDFITKDFDHKIHEIADVNRLSIIIYNLKGEVLLNTYKTNYDSTDSDNQMDPYLLYKLKSDTTGRIVSDTTGKIVGESYNGKINSYSYAKNKNNENMVIINIPYNPLNFNPKTEVWGFLNKLLEIFILLFIGAGVLAYFLSNYITKSIAEVRKKIEAVQITKTNEKLTWEKKDDIGVLVDAYNEMIDKLEISKNKLAKNERQIAWREMAKQVAHEIKNPLTPMKLSVQHLERSLNLIDENDLLILKDFEDKMIQQINLLTEIANEFSNFAELPKAKMKKVNVQKTIEKTMNLYKHHDLVSFNHDLNGVDFWIMGDENQLVRIFTNMFKNSIQAINQKGEIKVSLQKEEENIVVFIDDNGEGIPKEIKSHIFEPQFTTKSKGKGLGLAMVFQIVNNHSGKIELIDKKEKGACFKIVFPSLS